MGARDGAGPRRSEVTTRAVRSNAESSAQGRRKEKGGRCADRWGRRASEGKGRCAARLSCRAGETGHAACWAGGSGATWVGRGVENEPSGAERGIGLWGKGMEEKGWAASGFGGLTGLGLVSGFSPFPSLFFSISYFKHHSTYLNSNSNFNSTLTLNQIK